MTRRLARRLIGPVRVRTLLLIAVLVPLTAAMYFVVDDVRDHHAIEAEANRVEQAAVGAQHLLNARAALDSELRASDALAGVGGFDFDIAGILHDLGIDLSAQLAPARQMLDMELDNIRAMPDDVWADRAAVEQLLSAAGAISEHRDLLDTFTMTAADVTEIRTGLGASLDRATQTQIRSLGRVDDFVPGAGRLVELASTASDSAAYVDAVQLVTAEVITNYASFGGGRSSDPLASLQSSMELVDAEWQSLESRLDADRRVLVDEILAHPDVQRLNAEAEALIGGEPTGVGIPDIAGLVDLAVSVGETLNQITDGVVADLGAEAAEISDQAASDRRRSLVVGFFIGVTTTALLAMAVSMIVRPDRKSVV